MRLISSMWILLAPLILMSAVACSNQNVKNEKKPVEPSAATEQVPFIEQSWVELGPKAEWIIRAATSSAPCPSAIIDGETIPLLERAKTTQGGKQILICEAIVSRGKQTLTIMGQTHSLDLKTIKKIAVLGDTGCRIKSHADRMDVQDCNSANAWPFAKILNDAILPWHPDLIVHVGDYHYRESECPPGDTKCEGSIAGDNVNSWQQDFFQPASLALNRANWIFVRGNHEICARAGESWFRFLDAHSYQSKCSDATDPVVAAIGDVTLVWVDAADDHNIQPSLEKLSPTLAKHSLMFLHRPFLTPGADDEAKVESHLPLHMMKHHQLDAVITGHKHYFSFNEFNDHRPFEIISGNGGTKLLSPKAGVKLSDDGWSHESADGIKKTTYWRHGFLTLEREAEGWKASEHDVNGKVIFTHAVRDR